MAPSSSLSASASSDIARISIERVEDWNRIRDNFTDAVLTVLNDKLAQSSSQHVRDAVTAHLLHWRDMTFDAAKENIRVNGHNLEDYAEEQEETEPFDEVLDRRIWSLSTERMNWDKELAERRRTAPTEVRRLVEDLLDRQHAAEYVPPDVENNDMELDSSDARLAREDEVKSVYRQVEGLAEDLRKTAPLILERTERAHDVAEEIKNLPT